MFDSIIGTLTEQEVLVVTLNVAVFLQIIGLFFAVLIDQYISKEQRKTFLIVDALLAVLVIENQVGEALDFATTPYFIWIFLNILGYVLRPVVIMLFIRIIDDENQQTPLWALVGINAIIYMTAFVSPIAVSYNGGYFSRGPLGYSCHVVSLILILWNIAFTFYKYRDKIYREGIIPIFVSFSIIISVFADSSMGFNAPVTFLTTTMVSGCVFYYVWLHLQFVREHEDALKAEQRIQIMISQIQPHFLYNTLSTIQALCHADPEKAAEISEKFGTYLRQNLDSLDQSDLIPINKELEHTKIYSDIEQIRFPSIQVNYDVEEADFLLPALTIQPMVENAIRHGVRGRKQGLINVTSKKLDNCYEIRIKDNGKGFDVESLATMENTHIGIRNVKGRIETLCDGEFTIESVKDEGTCVIIRIPFSVEE
jgi:two-component sensor histidine kinase